MKRFGTTMIAVASVLAVAACSGSGGSSSDEKITLKVGTGLPDQHGMWQGDLITWMDRVEELTDGQVEFQTFTSGELVNAGKEIEGLLNGTIDIGLLIPSYSPDVTPMADVTLLPTQGADTYVYSKAYRKLMGDGVDLGGKGSYYDLTYEANDLKAFPIDTLQPYQISTTGKEINSLEALHSLSLRTPAQIMELYAANAGISSITMPAVDMFDALSRGAFDGSFITVPDWPAYGFQDLFRYTLTDMTFGTFNGSIGMTLDTWEELPTSVQEAMTQATEENVGAGSDLWIEREKEVVEDYEEQGGVFQSFNDLPADVQDEMLRAAEETWMDFIESMNGRGLPGREVAILWRDLVIEEGGEVPDAVKDL